MRGVPWLFGVCLAVAGIAGCEEDTPSNPADAADTDVAGDLVDTPDETPAEDAPGEADADADADDGIAVCEPLATDYQPRTGTDDWPACISDDNIYHWIEASSSTTARVGQFEQIAALLWNRTGVPGADDFLAARVVYTTENGLDSRVQRREDLHYPAVPAADGSCTDAGVPERYPDRCVGPGRILPILNDAFAAGSAGTDSLGNAARIEAALLWFLYVSPYKECHTCTTTPRDCDSCWAYYTGGEDRSGGMGISRYVRGEDVEAHDRVWDGLLAVRCWKNLDNETGESTDLAMRDRAIAQMDRALIRGVAMIVRARFLRLEVDTSGALQADWVFLQILGSALDREATVRDAALAAFLQAELSEDTPIAVDIDAAVSALDTLFPCP